MEIRRCDAVYELQAPWQQDCHLLRRSRHAVSAAPTPIWRLGTTTERPRFIESRMSPGGAANTGGVTPSVPCRPSGRPYSRISWSRITPRRSAARLTLNTWFKVTTHNDPLWSSAMRSTDSRNGSRLAPPPVDVIRFEVCQPARSTDQDNSRRIAGCSSHHSQQAVPGCISSPMVLHQFAQTA